MVSVLAAAVMLSSPVAPAPRVLAWFNGVDMLNGTHPRGYEALKVGDIIEVPYRGPNDRAMNDSTVEIDGHRFSLLQPEGDDLNTKVVVTEIFAGRQSGIGLDLANGQVHIKSLGAPQPSARQNIRLVIQTRGAVIAAGDVDATVRQRRLDVRVRNYSRRASDRVMVMPTEVEGVPAATTEFQPVAPLKQRVRLSGDGSFRADERIH